MYKKIIKRGGKLYSYYYHNVREQGRVKNIFLGDDKKEALVKLEQLKQDQAHKNLLSGAPSPVVKNYKTTYFLVILLVFAIGLGFLYFNQPSLTGLVIYEPQSIIKEIVTLNIPENLTINESIVLIKLNSQESSLSLNEFNIIENLVTIDLSKFNLLAEDGTLNVQILSNNDVISKTNLLIGTKTKQVVQPEHEIIESEISEVLIDNKVNEKLESKEKVRVLLRKKEDISKNKVENLVKDSKLEIKQEIDDLYAVEITSKDLEILKQSNEIKEIILDEEVNLFTLESINLMNIDKVKQEGYTGDGKSVCILDTGINYNLFNLELDNTVFGYDFVNNDNDPLDDNGHGTSVSNIVLQVASNSKIYSAKVINSDGIGYYSDVLAGLQYCIDNKVDVISFSIGAGLANGYCDSDLVASKANNAVDSGIYVVSSTGNDASSNSIRVPSCASKVTRVASSTKQDTISSFSNIYLNDLLATGENINTVGLNGENITLSGTSFSSPFVSAGALLILENRTLIPYDLTYLLRSTSEIINYNNINYNRLNLYNALINNITNIPYNYTAPQVIITEINFTVFAAPTQPQYLRPLNNTRVVISSIQLNWTNSTDADGGNISYLLDISNNSDFSNIVYRGRNDFINYTGSPGIDGGFSLLQAQSSINTRGITTNGSDFWITDIAQDYVYHFNSTGGNVTGTPGIYGGFSTRGVGVSGAASSPTSIVFNGSDFWVVDDASDYVYHFNSTGNNITGNPGIYGGFSINNTAIGELTIGSRAITTNGSDFWVSTASGSTDYIYHFNAFGTNVTGSPGAVGGFDLSVGVGGSGGTAFGITTNGSDFWVVDDSTTNQFVYHINYFGANITGEDDGFTLFKANGTDSSSISIKGIDTDIRLNTTALKIPNDFWVTDSNGDYVYHFKGAIPEQNIQGNTTHHNVSYGLERGKNYYWRVRAWSFNETGSYGYGNFTTNSAPNSSIPIINSTNILQSNTTTEDLQVRFNASDFNSQDTLNYSIQWFRNNITRFNFTNLPLTNPGTAVETLRNENTTKGQTWKAQILVCDNYNECNNFINTTELLILNSAPKYTAGYPQINSSEGNNRTTKNLMAIFIATDDDNSVVEEIDLLTYNITVFTNNITNFTIGTSISYTNGSLATQTIQSTNFTKGQTWKAQIGVYDGATTNFTNTSELLILNTPPAFQVNPVINSTNGLNTTEQNLNVFFTPNETDVNDNLNYSIQVFMNNRTNFTLYNIAATNGTFTNFIINNTNTTKGETWIAQVWIFDGTANSTLINTSEILILNIAPTLPLLNSPINNTFTSDNTTEFFVNNSDDADNDTIYYVLEIDDAFAFTSVNYQNGTIRKITNNTNSHNITSSLADGIYYWRARATDLSGNSSYTEIRNLTIDTKNGTILFVAPTESNNTYLSRNYIFINITVNETSLSNVTFYLVNSTSINITTFTSLLADDSRNINYTGINSNEIYKYNISVTDQLNNINYTETRTISLDTTLPNNITLLSPSNGTSASNRTPLLTWNNITEANFENYTLHIDDDADFSSIQFTYVKTGNVTNSTHQMIDILNDNTKYYWRVTARDKANNQNSTTFVYETSNPTASSSSSGSTSGGGGGGGGGATVLADIDIIEPGPITALSNDTIVVDVFVRNTGETSLNSITLSATSDSPNITLSLSKLFIPLLFAGQEDLSLLTINSLDNKLTGQYIVELKASVASPAITDIATIVISLIGIEEGTKNEAVKQLAFLKKLFEGNPECLELRELITEAENALNLQDYDKALQLADAAVQSCKDLVAAKGEIVQLPKQFKINDLVTLMLELIGFSFVAYGMYYYYKRRKIKLLARR